jgi:sugar fermentation stimulation protein A
MRFSSPLVAGTLIRRYKRFLADVALEDGRVVTAHCPNSGSMLSVDAPGAPVWLSPAPGAGRKLRYTWELIQVGGALVGVNTGRPNGLVEEAIRAAAIPELAGYSSIRREVRYGRNSRIDLLLEGEGRPTCYVEVKNVTMKRTLDAEAPVEFPDAVTERGVKHLVELAKRVGAGDRAAMLYLAQREDGRRLAIAADIDPAYARTLRRAMARGVEVLCYGCRVSTAEIRVGGPLAFARPEARRKRPARW